MMANVAAYLDAGRSVLYLGGNAMYRPTTAQAEQSGGELDLGRIETRPVLWPSYPLYEGKPLLAARTENLIFGASNHGIGLAVTDPDHRFMPGGLMPGQIVGTTGWTGDPGGQWRAFDWEMDEWDGPLPPDVSELGRDALNRGAALACYDTAAGGFVLGGGSITFVGSLMVGPRPTTNREQRSRGSAHQAVAR